MANVVIKTKTGHADMTGTAFRAYANHYRNAALACLTAPPAEGFDPAPYYLLCLSLELHLKSFIWLQDGSDHEKIKNDYRHNIKKLWQDSKDKGIGKYAQTTPLRDRVIALVGPYYKDRRFNYLDLNMVFNGYNNIRAERQAIPTLKRLTSQLGKSLHTPILRKS